MPSSDFAEGYGYAHAHVGRIRMDTMEWAWSRQFSERTTNMLTTITALALSPDDQKLACAGYNSFLGVSGGTTGYRYVFVLDPLDGKMVSSLLKIGYYSGYTLKSRGFLVRNSGIILSTHSSHNYVHASSEQEVMNLRAWDSVNMSRLYDMRVAKL